ncbi:MAG: hypothetical protein FJ088_07370 [Deltaproteobacteria bacterium]|nr:hypothetical protein [Deltaproteobacteria bacterium]
MKQKGSLVEEDRLRFDFAHMRKMTREEIAEVEDLVNAKILENSSVNTSIMPLEDAVKSGAMAFFGEKYGSMVRMVAMGSGESRELCGGTHVRFTGDIGFFKIIGESGISSGVRRIEAITGAAVAGYIRNKEKILSECCAILASSEREITKKISETLDEKERLEKEKNELKMKFTKESFDRDKKIIPFSDGELLIQGFPAIEPKLLRELSDQMKKEISKGVIFLYSHDVSGKAAVYISLTKDLSKKFHAGKIIKEILNKYGGKGGGSPEMAEGLSPSENIDQIEEEIKMKFLGKDYYHLP